MADKPMDVYLNDHLAGSMLGSDLAEQIQKETEGSPLGEVMSSIAAQIDEDRQSLIDLMERMGTSKNPVKQATTWLAEKASRTKFSGLTSGEDELGTFMALETLTLGVEGKASLWRALIAVADRYPSRWRRWTWRDCWRARRHSTRRWRTSGLRRRRSPCAASSEGPRSTPARTARGFAAGSSSSRTPLTWSGRASTADPPAASIPHCLLKKER